MEQNKISVIVPVYGVEKYLNRCVESIVNQTYRNLEILLVDDGSPDNCPSMCDEWALIDSRIKVIHKENGGLSDARNIGLADATGELIGFVDSDDWIAPNMYRNLFEVMEADNSDIATCGVKMVWEGGTASRMLTKTGRCILNQEEAMRALIEESWLKQPVWNRLYKAELIRNILFPVGKYHEDVFWSYQVIGKARRVSISDQVAYYYYQRNGSIMGEKYSLKRLDAIDAKVDRLNYIAVKFPTLEEIAKWDLLFLCMYSLQHAIRDLPEKEYRIALKKIISITSGIRPEYCLKNKSFKQKGWLLLSKLSFEKTCRLRNLLKVGL